MILYLVTVRAAKSPYHFEREYKMWCHSRAAATLQARAVKARLGVEPTTEQVVVPTDQAGLIAYLNALVAEGTVVARPAMPDGVAMVYATQPGTKEPASDGVALTSIAHPKGKRTRKARIDPKALETVEIEVPDSAPRKRRAKK